MPHATTSAGCPPPSWPRLIRRRKVSPVEVVDAVLDRIDALNPHLNAFVTLTADQARQGRAGRRAGAGKQRRHARAAARRAVLGQGPRHHQGGAHDVRDAALPRQRADRGRAHGRAHEGGRRHHARQDEHADLRLDRRHAQPPLRDHAQSLEPRSHAGRLQRRRRAAVAAGLGPLAVGTDGGGSIRIPAVLHGHLRLQALLRPRPGLPGRAAPGVSRTSGP